MNAKKEVNVMIVGDFLIFRNGLKLLVETADNIKVAGEAATLAEAFAMVPKVKPDVMLIDSVEIDAGDLASFRASLSEQPQIIVLTNSSDVEKQRKYLLLGIEGLVSKEQTADVLFEAIRQVGGGDVFFDRRLMSETIKLLVNEKNALPENLYSYNCAVLTEREREVLTLICQGMKNRLIADNLFITETTVRHHLTSIFEKLKVSSRLELVVYAFREKLVEIPPFEQGETTCGIGS